MATIAHIIDVGQGSMVLLQLSDGTVMMYDCNVTEENEDDVLAYLRRTIPGRRINIFVNSHRDADHMRGILKVHDTFPIGKVWDSGAVGETTDSTEYEQYMYLRRLVGCVTVNPRTKWDFGRTRIRVMNAKNDSLPGEANSQSIVMKVQQHDSVTGQIHDSLMLTGDSDAVAWKRAIMPNYTAGDLKSSILMASHHGSSTFFDDPGDRYYYVDHLKAIAPAMTVISVGPNVHGHPDEKALEFYHTHSRGSNQGNKVFRTDEKGNIVVILKDTGGWSLTPGQ